MLGVDKMGVILPGALLLPIMALYAGCGGAYGSHGLAAGKLQNVGRNNGY